MKWRAQPPWCDVSVLQTSPAGRLAALGTTAVREGRLDHPRVTGPREPAFVVVIEYKQTSSNYGCMLMYGVVS